MKTKRISAADLAAMTPAEAASYWFVRHDAQGITEDDRRAFETWLAASPAHRSAYERTGAMWENFEQRADDGELRALRAAALASGPAPHVRPLVVAAAAALIGAVGLAAFGLYSMTGWQDHLSARAQPPSADSTSQRSDVAQYQTARNERSTVTLADGTVVSMNLNTELEVAFSAEKRRVRLMRGQAFFEIAKSPKRPFVVEAADRQISALGTQFDVRLDPGRVEVVLLEGRVAVDRASSSILDTLIPRRTHVELKPGQRLVAVLGEPVSVTDTNAHRATSWRQGWIVFENETLEQAVAELNRYSDRPIRVPDEAIQQLRLSGVFRIGQPDRFGAIIQELLPIRTVQGEHNEMILVPLTGGGDSQH